MDRPQKVRLCFTCYFHLLQIFVATCEITFPYLARLNLTQSKPSNRLPEKKQKQKKTQKNRQILSEEWEILNDSRITS